MVKYGDFEVESWMSFYICVYICNNYPDQDAEYVYCPR